MTARRTTARATPSTASLDALLGLLHWNEQGLIPTVVQDATSKRVLTLCYLTREALERSLREGKVYVFRRSQNRLMLKGETSGHIQLIREVQVDCEGKSLLILVKQHVAGCHAGYFSCYYRQLSRRGTMRTIERRVFDPNAVYTSTKH